MNVHAKPQGVGLPCVERLDRLARVAIRVGLDLRPGQELVLTAPLDALPL
ncbi:aminopeptidase, partial [Methylobacterium trifolii]